MNNQTTTMHTARHWLAAVAVAVAVCAAPAQAMLVVTPQGADAAEGNSSNCIPVTGCVDAHRYQQVYDNSLFSSLSGPMEISELLFRRDLTSPTPFSIDFSNVLISLSTTQASAAALSTSFDNNVGADAVEVYSGALTLASASAGGIPAPLDISVVLQQAFTYDPAQGNLLLEWINLGGESVTGIFADSVFDNNDGTARIVGLAPGAPTGLADSSGLVTAFRVGTTEVALPPTLALLGIGIAGLLAGRRRPC